MEEEGTCSLRVFSSLGQGVGCSLPFPFGFAPSEMVQLIGWRALCGAEFAHGVSEMNGACLSRRGDPRRGKIPRERVCVCMCVRLRVGALRLGVEFFIARDNCFLTVF